MLWCWFHCHCCCFPVFDSSVFSFIPSSLSRSPSPSLPRCHCALNPVLSQWIHQSYALQPETERGKVFLCATVCGEDKEGEMVKEGEPRERESCPAQIVKESRQSGRIPDSEMWTVRKGLCLVGREHIQMSTCSWQCFLLLVFTFGSLLFNAASYVTIVSDLSIQLLLLCATNGCHLHVLHNHCSPFQNSIAWKNTHKHKIHSITWPWMCACKHSKISSEAASSVI